MAEIIFLGSSGAIQVPSYDCTCEVCEEARHSNTKRTRASIAILGSETTIIDASPDMPAQLEREGIRKIDNLFLTHWHFDHVWGLAELVEPSFTSKWPQVDLYLPEKDLPFFEKAMGYIRHSMNIAIHLVNPGDIIELNDVTVEVLKTNHTSGSVGYLVNSGRSLAYLLDSYIPPDETVGRIRDSDILVLGTTIDELVLPEGEKRWLHFTVDEALEFWKSLKIASCVFTHLSCHSYINGEIVPGLSQAERTRYEELYEGLVFAFDGMRITL